MKKLGKYEIVRELGRGAMGVVYEALDPLIRRKVALKTITTGLAENPDLLERFKREAQAAGNLQHPNIVTIYELGEDKGTFYIAMAFLEGESLEQIIARKQQMSLLQKVGYFVQVCRGLGYAHENGVVHRDMKPANIMVLKDDTIKVVDFGIARLTAASSTKTGMMIGTVAYMSPEQVQGQHVDQRSDIWSVGVTFYELFCGNRPFSADNIAAVMFNIVTQDPKPLRDYISDLPDDLEHLMSRIFQKKITDRYQNFDDVLLDLEPIYKRLQQAGVSEMVASAEQMIEIGELDRANDILRQVIQIEPGNRRARDLREQVQKEKARRAQAPQAQEHVNRASALLSQGRLAEAKSAALDALRLDSHFLPAKEFMEKLESAQLLEIARQRMAEGRHTDAEASLTQVLARDPNNAEAQKLRAQIAAERAERERRRQLEEKKQRARALWTQQKFDECIALLEQMLQEHPGESEVTSFLDTVRADKAEQERQAQIREVRRLLSEQKFSEAIEICEYRLQLNPNDAVVQRLLEQVQLERRDHARRVRQQQEQQILKRMVADGKYAEAIPRLDAHLTEFPDDFEARQLLDFARAQKAQEEQERLRAEKRKLVQSLLEKQEFEQAAAEAEDALAALPGDEELQQSLKTAQTKAKEKKEREAREYIQKQLASMQAAIEREDLSGAINIGKQTMVAAPQNAELTRLLQVAQTKHEERRKKREEEKAKEQVQTVYRQWKAGDIEQAQKGLEDLSKDGTMVFNAQVQNIFKEAVEKKAPLETVFGQLGNFLELPKEAPLPSAATVVAPAEARPAAPPPEEAKTTVAPKAAMEELARAEPPILERDFGKKKKKKEKGWRPPTDLDATTRFAEPLEAAPPEPMVKEPAAPPIAAADAAATRIGKIEEIPVPPKAAEPVTPPGSFTATTVVSPDKVTAPPPPPAKPPLGEAATRIGTREDIARLQQPPAPPASFTSTTIGKIEEAPVAPPVREKKEKKVERAKAEAPAIEMPVPEVAPKKSSMGLIAGGVAGVVVIGVALYFFLGRKPETTQTQTTATPAVEQPAPGTTTPPVTTPGPTTPVSPTAAPPADPWKTPVGSKVQALLSESRKLANKSDFAAANKKLDDAEKLKPEGVIAEAIRNERASVKKASEDKAYQAKSAQDNELLNQIATLRQTDTEDSLRRALDMTNTGISNNGPRIEDFRKLKPDIEARINFVKAEGVRKGILDEGNRLARSDNYAAARAKARELQSQGGDSSGLLSTINSAEQAKKSQLDGMFERYRRDKNTTGLDQLVGEYRKLIYDGGPLAGEARDMAENRIPAEIKNIRAAATPTPPITPPTKTSPTPTPVGCQASFKPWSSGSDKYTGALKAGQLLAENYIDGGLKLTTSPVPSNIAQQACGKSIRLRLNIDETGKVTGGTVQLGDAGLGKQLLDVAAQSWKFAPPKVANVPVKTVGTYQVSFQ